MGGGRGGGLFNGTKGSSTFNTNLSKLKNKYPVNDSGYFGDKGQSKGNVSIRNIKSNGPLSTAKDFYNIAKQGGKENLLANGKGKITKMNDGTTITFRRVSSSDGSPAIDIIIKGYGEIKSQKIHFVLEGK